MVLDQLTRLFGVHPEHAALIVADLVLLLTIIAVLGLNYRRVRARLTLFFLLFALLVVAATVLDMVEHFEPIHPLRMVPMTAALGVLLYILVE